MTDTNQLLRDAQQALESARHAIRNLVQTRPAVQWTKWLAVSGECDAVNDAIAAHLAAQPEAHPLTTNPVVRHEGLDLTDKAQAAQSGMVMVPRNHGLCTYPHCNGERPDDGGCCGRPFTSAMADAAERYWRTVGTNAHPLPAQFRWSECFRAIIAAAPQAVPAAEIDVRKIMLGIVPGADGMGHEVYAKSVADVENKLSSMGEELEEWQLGIRRILEAPAQPEAQSLVAAPSGMVMVPREPTEAWLDDVIVKAKVWPKDGIHYVPEAIREAVRTYHAAMIAAPQTVPQMLTDEEIALAIFEARVGHSPFKRDGSTSFRIARAAIAKFCEVNGITAKGDGNG